MPELDLAVHFLETKTQLLSHLDKSFWEPYLNFDALEQISLPQAYSRTDYIRASALLNEATLCAAIHHVIKNASSWRESP